MRKLLMASVIGGLMAGGVAVLPAHADSTCQNSSVGTWPNYATVSPYSDSSGSGAQGCVYTGTENGTVTAAGSGSQGYVAADGAPSNPVGSGYIAADDTGVYGCWTGDYAYGSSSNNSLVGAPDPQSPCAPSYTP